MKISTRRAAPIAALAAFALVLSACGGDDDDDAAATAAANDDEQDGEQDGDDDEIVVDNIGDMPDECVDAIGEMLERIEPIVEDVDFDNPDFSAFEDIGEQIEAEASDLGDDELEQRCEQYTLADDTDFGPLKDIARDRAPGTLAYIEWIEELQQEFADISIPDISIPDISIPDISIPDITIPDLTVPELTGAAADLPTDCEGAIAYMDALIAEGGGMMDLNVSELGAIGTVTTVITTDCAMGEVNEFFGRADVQEFMSG